MSNPVHTSETSMCGDLGHNFSAAWKAVHHKKIMRESQLCIAFQAGKDRETFYPRASSPSSSMHLGSSLWSGATRSPHSIALQAIPDLRNSSKFTLQANIRIFFKQKYICHKIICFSAFSIEKQGKRRAPLTRCPP
jgi:hypothetical protein